MIIIKKTFVLDLRYFACFDSPGPRIDHLGNRQSCALYNISRSQFSPWPTLHSRGQQHVVSQR